VPLGFGQYSFELRFIGFVFRVRNESRPWQYPAIASRLIMTAAFDNDDGVTAPGSAAISNPPCGDA
jgi:hypothetical protein